MYKKIILVFTIAIIFLLTGCRAAQPEEEMPVNSDVLRECIIYFQCDDCLVPVSVEEVWNENILNELYSQMCLSDSELAFSELTPILPHDTEITAKVEDQIASVEIYSPSIESLTATESENIVTAVVNTATQFNGIVGVQMVFNGSSDKLGSVDISDIMEKRSINPAYDIGELNAFEVYYQLGDTDYIIPVTKEAANLTPLTAINAMMKEPKNKNMRSLFPEGTKLLSADLNSGTLTLNFSKEFSAIESSPEKQCKLLLGMLTMLYDLEGVNEVHILIEGQELNTNYIEAKSAFANEMSFTGLKEEL